MNNTMTPQQIIKEIFAGSHRMLVDLRSTLDITDEVFEAMQAINNSASNGDDFYEVRTFLGNQEIKHNLDDWEALNTLECAIKSAEYCLANGNYTHTQVTVHGKYYDNGKPVEDGQVLWDSRIILVP